jgi:DNA-binding transcriptional regulator LsrR (DeoR family)
MYSDALLVKTAELYYYSRISQAEIGRILGVSTPTVSRILQEAMERGIIEVRIRDVLARSTDAEETLKKRFGLLDAVVVETPQETDQNFLRKLLGKKASELLPRFCERGSTVGIGCGITIREMIESLDRSRRFPDLRIVPLMGGWGKEDPERETNRLASSMGNILGCAFSYLLAPAIVSSPGVRDILLKEPQIQLTTKLWSSVDTALFSIGPELDAPAFSYIPAEYLDIGKAARAGGVGDVLGRIIDGRGKELPLPFNEHLMSIPFSTLRKIPRRVGIGGGPQKCRGVYAALRGKLANILVTDYETSSYILHLEAMERDSI